MKKDLTALQGELQLWAHKQHKAEVLAKRFATQGRAALSQKWAQAGRQAEREIERIGKRVAELEDQAREIVEPALTTPYRPTLIERLRPGRFRSGSLRSPAPRGPQPAPPVLLRPLVIRRLGQA